MIKAIFISLVFMFLEYESNSVYLSNGTRLIYNEDKSITIRESVNNQLTFTDNEVDELIGILLTANELTDYCKNKSNLVEYKKTIGTIGNCKFIYIFTRYEYDIEMRGLDTTYLKNGKMHNTIPSINIISPRNANLLLLYSNDIYSILTTKREKYYNDNEN